MPKPRIVQVLCGPERHAIIAIAYEPGITAALKEFWADPVMLLNESCVIAYVRGVVDGLIEGKSMNPWCGICGRRYEGWLFEDRATTFDTLAEALGPLRESEKQQIITRSLLDVLGLSHDAKTKSED